jgi:hypothetical protein
VCAAGSCVQACVCATAPSVTTCAVCSVTAELRPGGASLTFKRTHMPAVCCLALQSVKWAEDVAEVNETSGKRKSKSEGVPACWLGCWRCDVVHGSWCARLRSVSARAKHLPATPPAAAAAGTPIHACCQRASHTHTQSAASSTGGASLATGATTTTVTWTVTTATRRSSRTSTGSRRTRRRPMQLDRAAHSPRRQ